MRPIRNGLVERARHPVEDRFWGKVDRRGPEECWPWLGATSGGYGTFRVSPESGNAIASRFAYELTYGKLPSRRILVRHRCDNPPCCNPAHLVSGSYFDNEHDKIERGRNRKAVGERASKSKLTTAQVRFIRYVYARRLRNQSELAREFRVRSCSINLIVRRLTWRHL